MLLTAYLSQSPAVQSLNALAETEDTLSYQATMTIGGKTVRTYGRLGAERRKDLAPGDRPAWLSGCLGDTLADGQDLIQAGEVEDPAHLLVGRHQRQPPLMTLQPLMGPDYDPETTGVHELNLLHIDRDAVVPVVHRLINRLAQHGAGIYVDLADQLEDGPIAGLAGFDLELYGFLPVPAL